MSVEDFLLLFCHFALFFYGFQILRHHSKRLHRSAFQLAKPTDRCFIRSITAKMKASNSFNCNNTTLSNCFSGICDCGSAPLISPDQIDFRPTFITTDRLCIISSCLRIMVFTGTFRAHRKFFHTCPLPVIRKRIQNRKPRSTTGAVDKRMQISPVLRIKHFLFAFLTDCDIRRNKNFTLCLLALDDIKLCISLRILYIFYIYFKDCRTLRRSILDI